MSRYFFIGGFLGFCLVFFLSLASGANVHIVLRNSMIGSMAVAILFRYYFNRISQLYIQAKLRSIERSMRESASAGRKHS